jgi:hypothetical protein
MVLLSEYKKKRDADTKKANFKTLGNNGATADNRDDQTKYLTGISRSQGHGTGRHRLRQLRYTAQCCGGRKEAWLLSQGRVVAGDHHADYGYQGRKRPADVQCDGDALVSGKNHDAFGASVHAWSATDHCRSRYGPSIDRKAGLRRDGVSWQVSIWTLCGTKFTCTTSATLARSCWGWASSLWAPCQIFHSSLQTFKSLLRTCRMR